MKLKFKQSLKMVFLFLVFLTGNSFMNYQENMSNANDSILGKWINEDKTKIIEFKKNGSKYEAYVVKSNNHDLVGKRMIYDLVFDGKKYNGKVFMPKRNKTFNCIISIKNSNVMNLTANAGYMSQSKTWTKVE